MAEKLFYGLPISETELKQAWPEIETWDDFCAVIANLESFVMLKLRFDETWERCSHYYDLLKAFQVAREDPIRKKLGERESAILENIFPYDRLVEKINERVESDGLYVEHVCAWQNGTGEGLSEENIHEMLVEKYGESMRDWCAHVHDLENRTIGGLWHAHVFVLVKRELGRDDLLA